MVTPPSVEVGLLKTKENLTGLLAQLLFLRIGWIKLARG